MAPVLSSMTDLRRNTGSQSALITLRLSSSVLRTRTSIASLFVQTRWSSVGWNQNFCAYSTALSRSTSGPGRGERGTVPNPVHLRGERGTVHFTRVPDQVQFVAEPAHAGQQAGDVHHPGPAQIGRPGRQRAHRCGVPTGRGE